LTSFGFAAILSFKASRLTIDIKNKLAALKSLHCRVTSDGKILLLNQP
jgi:hypothetical protein